jgi:FtsH-binding integral membrane protein
VTPTTTSSSKATAERGDFLEANVFSRRKSEGALVSLNTYNLLIGLAVCWGLLVNWLMVRYLDPGVIESWDRTVFIIAYFASCLLGVWMFNTSTDPAVSFTGYNLVVVPFGLIVNLVVSRYDPDVVLQAVETTALVTVGMMTLGSLFPRLFAAARGSLAIALLLTLAIQVTRVMLFHWDPSLYDWVIVVVFCGYIGYDWGRAQRIPPTVDNAIDSAAEIYMDVINLFLRILRLLGRGRKR